MNPREAGFLQLTSHLGIPERKVLTTAQLRTLADRMHGADWPCEDRALEESDLVSLGYSRAMAARILSLLEEEDLLRHYCARAEKNGCIPITWASEQYPDILSQRLMSESPGCLWAKGDLRLLGSCCVSLVGSRDLLLANRKFAEEVGRMAARQGLTLVSGNARGADRTAQDACIAAGGCVISIVADELEKHPVRENVLYLSEDGFDEPFSAQRALSRNRCIHALGRITFVAQTGLHKGGTWRGTAKNLQHGWSTVACFRDGSEATQELEQMGAYLIGMEDLQDFSGLQQQQKSFF